jgi:hypothetical protein
MQRDLKLQNQIKYMTKQIKEDTSGH